MRYLLLVLLVGCAPAYASNQAPTPSKLTFAAAFDCAQAQVNALGYVIQDANRDAGLVRGKTTSPDAMRLNGEPVFNEITVSITKTDTGPVLHVSAHNKDHAKAVLAACGG